MKSRGTIPVPPAPLAWQDGLDHLGGICRKTLSLIRRVFGECMFGVKESNLKYVHGACILFVTPDVPGKPSYHLESLSFSFSSMLNSTRTQTASPMHSVSTASCREFHVVSMGWRLAPPRFGMMMQSITRL